MKWMSPKEKWINIEKELINELIGIILKDIDTKAIPYKEYMVYNL